MMMGKGIINQINSDAFNAKSKNQSKNHTHAFPSLKSCRIMFVRDVGFHPTSLTNNNANTSISILILGITTKRRGRDFNKYNLITGRSIFMFRKNIIARKTAEKDVVTLGRFIMEVCHYG